MKEIVDLLKSEIEYFKKLKSAIGGIHGHIHSLAVKTGKIYLTGLYPEVQCWELSEKFGSGIDIIGRSKNNSIIVVAEVKTTYRSEKETLGKPQRSRIKKDVEGLIKVSAKYKYLFIIDNKNRKAIEAIIKSLDAKDIVLVNILE